VIVGRAGKSFPSGHSLTSFVALGLLLIMLWSRLTPGPRAGLAAACALVVAAVGVSRLMLGVHYPTDVLGGWLFGLGWLLAVTLLARRLPRRVDAPASTTPG
jgi:undecaprenyl-diphosphatase